MKVIMNPPFKLCKNKKFFNIVKSLKDCVCLATFRFCNSLGNYDLILPEEWVEITPTTPLAIYHSHGEYNKEDMPKFYLKQVSCPVDGFLTYTNTHFTDVERKNSYKIFKLKKLTPEDFISKSSNKFIKKGDIIKKFVVPEKDYSQYEEQIFIDSYKWKTSMNRNILIREDFTL